MASSTGAVPQCSAPRNRLSRRALIFQNVCQCDHVKLLMCSVPFSLAVNPPLKCRSTFVKEKKFSLHCRNFKDFTKVWCSSHLTKGTWFFNERVWSVATWLWWCVGPGGVGLVYWCAGCNCESLGWEGGIWRVCGLLREWKCWGIGVNTKGGWFVEV